MNLICCKNKKNVEPRKSPVVHWDMRHKKFVDSVIEEKSFDVCKVMQIGYFGATIIVNRNETEAECKVQILKKEYTGEKVIECNKFSHRNIVPLLKLEYLKNADSYLFYWPVEKNTLQETIEDKIFRKDPRALWKLVNWLKETADATQYLHSCGYAHCNLQAKNLIITKDDVLQISEFHHLNSTNNRTNR